MLKRDIPFDQVLIATLKSSFPFDTAQNYTNSRLEKYALRVKQYAVRV